VRLISDPLVVKYFPSLAKAASTVGSLQIRNLATLAGNVMTAQPAADGAMALAPLEPRFVVLSEEGERLGTDGPDVCRIRQNRPGPE
jgi:CO/xanthine dehydrogenase FAD-binding subunit